MSGVDMRVKCHAGMGCVMLGCGWGGVGHVRGGMWWDGSCIGWVM